MSRDDVSTIVAVSSQFVSIRLEIDIRSFASALLLASDEGLIQSHLR